MSREQRQKSYVFYDSYFQAIDQASETEQLQLFRGITIYALYGEEPKFKGLLQAVWLSIKPQLDANYKKYLNGCKGAEHGKKGGRPKKPKKPQKNPTRTPNVNDNVNVELDELDVDAHAREEDLSQDFCIATDTGYKAVDWKAFERAVKRKGEEMNIPAASIKRFLDYTQKNLVTYNCGDGRLYDANGKPLRNWVGALVGYANSGYDREEWLKENGLK